MAPIAEAHHHRSTTKASHKPFKSKHSTKGFLKGLSKGATTLNAAYQRRANLLTGKVEDGEKKHRKTPHQQVMSKINRRHQARQKQQSKHQEHAKATSVFSGQHGASRIVAVIPLCEDADARAAVYKLNKGLDLSVEVPSDGLVRVRVDRFKQNILYIPVARNLLDALDSCRTADFVVFLLSPHQEVDDLGELMIRSIEGQGVSNVVTAVQGLDGIQPVKKQPQVLTSLKSYVTHFFPTQEKVHSLDSHQDCANVIRSLCTTTPKGVRWREDRSWMLVEEVQWPSQNDPSTNSLGAVVVTGVVRGKSLKSNRLVRMGDWGDFQIEKVTAAVLPLSRKRKADEMVVEEQPNTEVTLETPDEDQDDLADLAPHDVSMDDVDDMPIFEAHTEKRGVLLDDHHYFSDDETHLPEAPRRLPKGTSSYQAAWFLGDMSESESEDEDAVDEDGDLNMGAPALPQDRVEGLDTAPDRDPTEAAPSEYPQSEMFLDPSPDDEAEQLAAYRSQRKSEAEEDLEFPDEIELQPNVLARERLARYRGLKSLRTSHWEIHEDRAHEPEDWNRLLQIANYKGAKSQALREALLGGVQPGTRVHVHLRNVPLSLQASHSSSKPLALVSLLRHEHKRTVVNYSITLSSDYPNPIRSKEELIMQCGPRRLMIKPLFSQAGNTPNNVHKFDRYLHPGRTAIATFIAPLTWGSVPTLFFKTPSPASTQPSSTTMTDAPSAPPLPLELIATGTSLPPDRSRIVAKRVILTGHPFKIHKKLVTVRYMFFNAEDVNWFKALQLWTKRGRSGFVKESLGTHGYFKATFDGKINPQDAVGVSLYKRVFPRDAVAWRPYEIGGLEEA